MYGEVARFAVPVVNELVGAAVDVAVGDENIFAAEKMGKDCIDGGHTAIKIPCEIFTCVGTCF
jgi:hypothetical protein